MATKKSKIQMEEIVATDIDKAGLLEALKRLRPGLGAVEYSGNYLLLKDRVASFNREVAVQSRFYTGVECSVDGEKLLALLGKMKADKLKMKVDQEQLVVTGERQSFGMKLGGQDDALFQRLEELSYETMKWKTIPEKLKDGLTFCAYSASKEVTKPQLMGVYVDGRDIVSSDNLRISWYFLPEPFPGGPILIPASEYLEVSSYPCEKYAMSDGWFHFMGGGLYYSLLLIEEVEVFPAAAAKGFFPEKVTSSKQFAFPKTFPTALTNSAILSKEKPTVDQSVKIFSKKGALYCRAETDNEWYEESIEFSGSVPDFEIAINPAHLSEILKYDPKCYLMKEGQALFLSGSFKHLISY